MVTLFHFDCLALHALIGPYPAPVSLAVGAEWFSSGLLDDVDGCPPPSPPSLFPVTVEWFSDSLLFCNPPFLVRSALSRLVLLGDRVLVVRPELELVDDESLDGPGWDASPILSPACNSGDPLF